MKWRLDYCEIDLQWNREFFPIKLPPQRPIIISKTECRRWGSLGYEILQKVQQ
jgi:hypothetical protein